MYSTIDLHGVSHYKVSEILDKKIWESMNSGKSGLKIITGNSDRMKQFSISVIKEYGFHYQIGDPINNGYILVFLK
jgi:hypothetical protein